MALAPLWARRAGAPRARWWRARWCLDVTAGGWPCRRRAGARAADSVLRFRAPAPELPELAPGAAEFLVAPVWPEPEQLQPVRKAPEQAETSESAPAFCDTQIPPQPAEQAELRPTANRSGACNRAQETLLAEWNTSLR